MISDFFHSLHTASDDAIYGSVPEGSLGDAIGGVLGLPGRVLALVEYILMDFGS